MTNRRPSAALFGLVLLVCFLAVRPAAAQQQPPTSGNLAIAVIDIQYIIRESLATKSMRPQLAKMKVAFESEMKRQEVELRKANKELIGQRPILSPDAYTQRRKELQKKASAAQRSVQSRKRTIDKAIGRTMSEVHRVLREITIEIAKEKSISLVFSKSALFLSENRHDITIEALKRLNKKLPSVDVTQREKK